MAVREFFHLMHMVDDLDQSDPVFRRIFGPDVYAPKGWSPYDKRFATLWRIGPDFVLEIMEASKADEDQSWPLPKFYRRFGQHLHSFAWYMDEEERVPLYRRLSKGGVRVVGASGVIPEDVSDDDIPPLLFTHGRDTFGQIEFMVNDPAAGARDPLFTEGWDRHQWDDHPLGRIRASHLTNAVDDLDRAKEVFVDMIGGTLFHERKDEAARRAYVLVGLDTVIELAQPTAAGTRLSEDLERHGPLPHMATFLVRDLDAAARHVEESGAKVAERDDETFVVDPATTHDALLAFTVARLPNDPRD